MCVSAMTGREASTRGEWPRREGLLGRGRPRWEGLLEAPGCGCWDSPKLDLHNSHIYASFMNKLSLLLFCRTFKKVDGVAPLVTTSGLREGISD